ncbi:MAG: NEW3 domain-containing protein [Candidatus Bathyarchaeia archaeon]
MKGLIRMKTLIIGLVTLLMLTTSSNFVAAQTASVVGRVVDEDGVGLSEVKVEVYSSDRFLYALTNTDPEGYFKVSYLPMDVFTFEFSKAGYITKSVSVKTDGRTMVDLDELVLIKALKITSPVLSLVANPGDELLLPFTVSNVGKDPETVEFSVSKPEGWLTRIINQLGEVTKVYLSAGTSLNFDLEVTIPQASIGNNSLSLKVVGKTSSTLNFTILVKSPDKPMISCRVVDEEGEGLGDVKVEVYSSGGSYIKSGQTDPDGYFTIYHLQIGAYVLHFYKPGYVKVTKTSTLSDKTLNLGDIVLLRTLRMSSSILSRVASPGDKLLIPFTVSNIGEETENVEFFVSKPEGWSTRILDQTNEVTRVSLEPSKSLNLQLEVTIPLTSTGNNTLSLASVGKMKTTLMFTITVKPSNKPVIFCQFPGKSTTPSDTVKFQVRVKNPFGIETSFRVAVDSVPLNWTASVKSVGGEAVTEVTLDSGEFIDLIIEVTPPATAKIGEYKILFKAESTDGNVTALLPLNITLTEVEKEEINIVATFREVTVEAGKVLQCPITIINSGETNRTLLLSVVEYPPGWKVSFKSGTVDVSGLYLTAGKSENLVLEVTPPSTVNIGTYTVPVQVESEDGAVRIRRDFKVTITGSYALKLEPSTLFTDSTVGGSTTFTTKITNTGQTPVTGLRLSVDTPQGWEASVTPAHVESLKPLESSTFTIVVKNPDNTAAGDYLLTLKGLSDQVESDKVQIRVTTTAPTSWGLMGIGIAAVMVVALIVVFKKFRRR